jgi:RND family efflux transporter MFP subunit
LFGPNRSVALVARVRAGTAVNAVSGTVIVQASEAQAIKSEISGRVTEMAMALDKRVAAGETLVQLDTGDLLLDIDRVQSQLGAAKRKLELGSSFDSELQNARDALAELVRLQGRGTSSEVEVLRQKRVVQGIEQRRDQEQLARQLEIEGLENQLKVQRRQLEKMTIRAPFEGVIAEVRTGRGDLISGGTPIARLISIQRIVEGRLSEENFAGVRVGQRAIVSFLPYGVTQFDAKVVKVLSTSDPETQRYIVHLEIAPGQLEASKLIPGITGDLSVILDERPSKTLIPRRALVGNSVKVVADGRVRQRLVKVGFVSLTAVEILDGLAEGELVIVDEVDRFNDGQSVRFELSADPRWR